MKTRPGGPERVGNFTNFCSMIPLYPIGGVMIMTHSVINEFSAGLSYSGSGELNVLGGAFNMAELYSAERTVRAMVLRLT